MLCYASRFESSLCSSAPEDLQVLFSWWLKRKKLDHLFDELKKIAAEDREYHSRTMLSEGDHHAYITRQSRRLDILNRIAEVNARNQKGTRSQYSCL